jgi:hypothetical protein
MEKQHLSGVDTTFKDINGNAIRVHSYIRDGEGQLYFINSHCQAVPEGGEAPAVELAKLVEGSEVTLLTSEEVLDVHKPALEQRRRRLRPRRAKEGDDAAPAQEGKGPEVPEGMLPVSITMVLSALPDKVLAEELRRRGYTLSASKPVFIQL